MFERYTERARRVLFFARYEASQYGQLSINPEHLLLGLVREGKGLTSRLFGLSNLTLEGLRSEVLSRMTIGEKFPTSVEIPFEAATTRVLQFAAEEADRLLHNYIGTEHLLLGILRENGTVAADILRARGLEFETVRQQIVDLLRENHPPPIRQGLGLRSRNPEYFFNHGMQLKELVSRLLRVKSNRLALAGDLDRTLAVIREPREVGVFVLAAAPDRHPPTHSKGSIGASLGIESTDSLGPLSMQGATMAELAETLEDIVGCPIVDETGLAGRYDVQVSGPHDSIDTFRAALEREMGLTLTLARREIEMVVVF